MAGESLEGSECLVKDMGFHNKVFTWGEGIKRLSLANVEGTGWKEGSRETSGKVA